MDLVFQPVHVDTDKVNFLAAQVKRRRLYGRASGKIRLTDGREIPVEDEHFFVELADERW